jgi:hypothetical protein
MTPTQQIFVVFFAIFLGAVSNTHGRWKMFNWALLRHGHVARRVILSLVMMDVLPIVYFAVILFRLRNTPTTATSAWSLGETFRQVSVGVIPAFAVIGFYRLWLTIVQMRPAWFYQRARDQGPLLAEIEPTVEQLHLDRAEWPWELSFAIVYLTVATLVPCTLAP